MTDADPIKPFSRVHLCVMGFTQSTLRRTGMERLWLEVLRPLSNEVTLVLPPITWDADPEPVASLIDRTAAAGASIRATAYSWGGGYFFPRFCASLAKRGRTIDTALLVDAVYRSRLLPAWLPFNPLSLTTLPRVVVPSNVRRVAWFRQRRDNPSGHDVVIDPSSTSLVSSKWLDVGHVEMDDDPHVRASAEFLHAELE